MERLGRLGIQIATTACTTTRRFSQDQMALTIEAPGRRNNGPFLATCCLAMCFLDYLCRSVAQLTANPQGCVHCSFMLIYLHMALNHSGAAETGKQQERVCSRQDSSFFAAATTRPPPSVTERGRMLHEVRPPALSGLVLIHSVCPGYARGPSYSSVQRVSVDELVVLSSRHASYPVSLPGESSTSSGVVGWAIRMAYRGVFSALYGPITCSS